MFNNLKLQLLAHGLRLSTGLMLTLAGLNKLLISNGYASMINNTESLQFMKDVLIPALPWAELLVGLLLLFGLWTTWAALASAIMFLGMSIFLGFNNADSMMLSYHGYVFFTSLSLFLGGKQGGPTLDRILEKKFTKVEKISV